MGFYSFCGIITLIFAVIGLTLMLNGIDKNLGNDYPIYGYGTFTVIDQYLKNNTCSVCTSYSNPCKKRNANLIKRYIPYIPAPPPPPRTKPPCNTQCSTRKYYECYDEFVVIKKDTIICTFHVGTSDKSQNESQKQIDDLFPNGTQMEKYFNKKDGTCVYDSSSIVAMADAGFAFVCITFVCIIFLIFMMLNDDNLRNKTNISCSDNTHIYNEHAETSI